MLFSEYSTVAQKVIMYLKSNTGSTGFSCSFFFPFKSKENSEGITGSHLQERKGKIDLFMAKSTVL